MLIANTLTQAECLLHCLEQSAKGIGLSVFMCFKQDDAIFILDDKPLKIVEHFTYIGSNITSTESDVNINVGGYGPLLTGY